MLTRSCNTIVMHANAYAVHSDVLGFGDIVENFNLVALCSDLNLLNLLKPKELLSRQERTSELTNILFQVGSRREKARPVLLLRVSIWEKVIFFHRPPFEFRMSSLILFQTLNIVTWRRIPQMKSRLALFRLELVDSLNESIEVVKSEKTIFVLEIVAKKHH